MPVHSRSWGSLLVAISAILLPSTYPVISVGGGGVPDAFLNKSLDVNLQERIDLDELAQGRPQSLMPLTEQPYMYFAADMDTESRRDGNSKGDF